MQQTREDGIQVEAAVEAVLAFGEVAVRVLGEVERMVGTGDRGLQMYFINQALQLTPSWRISSSAGRAPLSPMQFAAS